MPNNKRPSPAPRVPTLADVLSALQTAQGLSPGRIRDLRSAVSRFCNLTGEAASRITLDLGEIRNRINAINPVAAGLSAKSFANIRSDLFAAIKASR